MGNLHVGKERKEGKTPAENRLQVVADATIL